MSMTEFVIAARATACRMPERLVVAPVTHVLGSGSAYSTGGNPNFGTDATGIVGVRDAKQAAPPRGELR
jgi:hypothetical protein